MTSGPTNSQQHPAVSLTLPISATTMPNATLTGIPTEIRQEIVRLALPAALFSSSPNQPVRLCRSGLFLVCRTDSQCKRDPEAPPQTLLVFTTAQEFAVFVEHLSEGSLRCIRQIELAFSIREHVSFFNVRWRQEVPVKKNSASRQLLPRLTELRCLHL